MNTVIKWIDGFLLNENKLIVYLIHKSFVKLLNDHYYKNSIILTGKVPAKKRKLLVNKFTKDKNINLLIANIQAVGTGTDGLQYNCYNSCTIELGWDPDDHDQAEDRLCRIGQKYGVMNYYLLGIGTIEIEIAKLLDKKRKINEAILDGKKVTIEYVDIEEGK